MQSGNTRSRMGYLWTALLAVLVVLMIAILLKPEREPSTRVGRAVEDLRDGINDARRDLKSDQTLGERIGNGIEDAGRSIKDAAD